MLREEIIAPFLDLVQKIQVAKYREMLALTARIPKKKRTQASSLKPVLPLVPEELPKVDEDKSVFISMELRSRAGGPAGQTYKKYIRKFEEGTPQQWIDLLRDFKEVWAQNSINGGADRAATVRSLLRGDSLTAFNTALEDERAPEDAEAPPLAITVKMVETALDAVTLAVFPHRALEIQKLWMQRGMKKPFELSTRKTAAAVTRLNNALPLFPGGTEQSKFSDFEIVGLLEWAVPAMWREKFDLEGYIPTQGTKAAFIEKCEAIERNQILEKESTKSTNKGNKKSGKFERANGAKSEAPRNFYCKLHGKNSTHNTTDCWTLKNQQDNGKTDKSSNKNNRSFSNRAFKKEINLLSRGKNKEEVLDLYAAALTRERAKLQKQKKRKVQKESTSDSESDHSVNNMEIEVLKPPAKRKKAKGSKKKALTETTEEEEAFLKQIQAEDGEISSDESSGSED